MDLGNKVKALLGSQKEILKEYEDVLKQISEDDSINENIQLKKDLIKLKEDLKEVKEKTQKFEKENIAIKIALKEQMFNERNSILSASLKKVHLYFESEEKGAINRLLYLENSAKQKLKEISSIAREEFLDNKEEIDGEINGLEQALDEKIAIQKEKIIESHKSTLEEIKVTYDNEKREITEEELIKKQKHNNIEVNIGLNWINKVGVILLLFGVATAMQYTYSAWFTDYMKAISGFLLGGLMLGAGEWFNKKEKNLFALGLCGAGIGVLYLAVFSSYFFFRILNLPMSIVVSVLITLGAIVLSQRYNSRTIAGISLVGGYLPFFSYGLLMEMWGTGVYVAMGYLIILNLLMLVIALGRRWIFINYLSFILNMPCLILLVFWVDNDVVGIIYGLLTFIMYLGITLAYPIKENIKLKVADLILLAFNTVINCILIYFLFYVAGFEDYGGFLALAYALGYFALSRVIRKRYSQEKHIEALFSITALTFTILMIPFQFGIQWAAMGWLIEAILILAFVKKRGVEKIELGGWIILGLCALGFLINDINWGWNIEYFALRYSLLTFGLAYVYSLYLPEYKINPTMKYSDKGKLINLLKYIVIFNIWIYLLRIFGKAYDIYMIKLMPIDYVDFYKIIILAMITIVFAYGIVKIKAIRDKGVITISTGLLILSNMTCILLTFNRTGGAPTPAARWIGTIILIVYNILVFLSIKDLTLQLVLRQRRSIEYYPLAMVIYLLGVVTGFLTIQLDLHNINLIISIVFVVSAMGCIIFGFKKNYLLIRRFGLGLSIFATVKLFIFDLSNLEGAGKIIGYFCFGLVLMAISFIYQKLNTSLKEEGHSEESS